MKNKDFEKMCLIAIRKLVFEQKLIGWGELLHALDSDFWGYALLQKKLERCPKFGNDQEEADSMMKELHQFVCMTAKAQAKRVGLDSYLIVVINNSANNGKVKIARRTGNSL